MSALPALDADVDAELEPEPVAGAKFRLAAGKGGELWVRSMTESDGGGLAEVEVDEACLDLEEEEEEAGRTSPLSRSLKESGGGLRLGDGACAVAEAKEVVA